VLSAFVSSDNEAEQIGEAERCAAFEFAIYPTYSDRRCSSRKHCNRIGAGAVAPYRIAEALLLPKVDPRLVLDIELYRQLSK
jgi:hypothetical protein